MLLDGWSIATSSGGRVDNWVALPVALALHKLPEGVALGALLRASEPRVWPPRMVSGRRIHDDGRSRRGLRSRSRERPLAALSAGIAGLFLLPGISRRARRVAQTQELGAFLPGSPGPPEPRR